MKTPGVGWLQRDPQPRAARPERSVFPPIGSTVLYTLGNGPSRGQQRPALVLRHIEREGAAGWLVVALQVFTDPRADGLEPHVCDAAFSETPLPWHWSATDCYEASR